MDPPKVKLHLDFDNFTPKIKLVFGALLLNSVIILILSITIYFFVENEKIELIIANLRVSNSYYFYIFNAQNLLRVLSSYCLQAAVLEEGLFRYPILALVKSNLKIHIKYDITKLFLVILALGLNLMWAIGFEPLTGGHPTPIPVFLVGIPLYWLVIKTKSLWPAILCHASSNFLLYILVQVLIYKDVL